MKSIYKSPQGKATIINFYESILNNWQHPFEQRSITTDFGDTFVISSGKESAAAMVLLHGSGSNSAMWLADVKFYAEKFRVHCIDIIGECGNSAENRPDWTGDNYSNWLAQIFATLHIENAVLIGSSIGGWIVTDFTIRHPQKVNKLILLAPAGFTQIRLQTIFWIILTSFLGTWGFKKLNELVYGGLEIDETALQFAGLVREHYNPRTDVLPIFSDKQLQHIRCPLLFIGGEQDCFYNSRKSARRIESNTPQAETNILNTGHVLVNQAPAILKFVGVPT